MAVDVAVGCSLCVLLLDLLLKLRMTAFRLSALIARRPTASKALPRRSPGSRTTEAAQTIVGSEPSWLRQRHAELVRELLVYLVTLRQSG
jgi:hypothetical protein